MNPDLIKQQPFIDCTRGNGFSYFRISKSMMQVGHSLGIGTDEVLLYTLLRDRAKLSYENRNYNADGSLFVFCTRPHAAAYFGWSTRKVVDLFHSLSDHKLIREEAVFDSKGRQKASRIYLSIWSVPSLLFSREDFENLRFPALTVDSLLSMDIGDYYILPKTLLEDDRYHGMSLRAMLLYMLLLDRIALSQRYGRVDENGLLWTTMDAEIMGKELDCSKRSLSRATVELEEIGLIQRRAVSYAEKWRIYVRDFLPPASEASPAPTQAAPVSEDAEWLPAAEMAQDYPFDAKSAPLCSQVCTPVVPVLQPCDAISAPSVLPDLHPNKPSYIKNPVNKFSQTTSIPDQSLRSETELFDAGMSDFEKRKKYALREMELQYQSMELCHYSEAIDLCYQGLSETDADVAVEILDRSVDVIQEILASPLPCQLLGKESVATGEVLRRLGELDEFTMFLIIQKTMHRWAEIRDKAAYLRRTLYLGSRQHRQESFFLKKSIENHMFGYAEAEQAY